MKTIVTLSIVVMLFLFIFSACTQQSAPVQEKNMASTASVSVPQPEFDGIPQPPAPLGIVEEGTQ